MENFKVEENSKGNKEGIIEVDGRKIEVTYVDENPAFNSEDAPEGFVEGGGSEDEVYGDE